MKKTVLAVILFLTLTTGLTLLIQPAKAASVTILSHSGYLDSVGGYWIYGEFQNLDTTPISGVRVTATFYDSSNTIVAVENGNSYLDVILSNRKSPFDVLLYDLTQNKTQQLGLRVDHYTLAVNYTFAHATSALPLDLRILSNSSNVDIMGIMHIKGEVENADVKNATHPRVVATCYDSNGKVVFADSAYTGGGFEVIPSGQKSTFDLQLVGLESVSLVKSYLLTAEDVEPSSPLTPTPTPTLTLAPSVSPISTLTSAAPLSPFVSPTPASTPAPSSPPTFAQLTTVAWVPPPQNAAAATIVTAVAVGVVSIVVAAATNSGGTSAGKAVEKARELLPESVKKWLADFASSKRKPALEQKTGSPFLPTKAEALAYGVSLAVLTISFSYVKVNDFTLILMVLPTILATAVIVELVKTFALVVFARKLGVWTEHRLWYFGLAMFLVTTFAFGIPFSSPSRSLYHAPEFTKSREGIVSAAAILVTLAFAAFFFVLLISGFTLIGSTGLAMCVIMAFLDTFPVAPMNGKAIYQHRKAVWAVLFIVTLTLYASWLILL